MKRFAALWALGLVPVASAQDAAPPPAPPADQPSAPLIAPPAPPAAPTDPGSFWEGWSGSAEAGLNGSTGNSSSFNIRAAIKAERKLELRQTAFSLTYTRASTDEDVTENRLEAEGRDDWLFAESPRWRYFLTGRYEYDDFQDWQHRVSLGNGLGYALIKTDDTELLGRIGIGAFQEIGGGDPRIHPEGILGADFAAQLTERQKLTLTAEYLPDLLEFPAYKARAKAAWEILVDPDSKLVLKLGAEDRYDSSPGEDKHRNDLDFFLTLGIKF